MPSSTPSVVELRRHNADAAAQLLEDLGDVYADARAEPPYADDARWSRDAFIARTAKQATNPRFLLITAHGGAEMVGFSFGLPVAPGRWFEGDTAPPDDVLAAPKFSVIELDVLRSWRNRGVGRALLDELLAGRPEAYAMLSTLPEAPAHQMYERWGWRVVAQTLPDSGLPPWNTLILPLVASSHPL